MRLLSILLSLYTIMVALYLLGKTLDVALLKQVTPVLAPLVEPVTAFIRKLLGKHVPERYQRINWPVYVLLLVLVLLNIIL